MLRARRTLTLVATALVAGSLMLSGCGRNAVNPLAPSEEEAAGELPGEEEEEGGGELPFPMPGGGSSGGGYIVPSKPGVAPAKPSTGAKPAGGLRPLPKPTPTAPPKGGSGGGNPTADMAGFVELLGNFGYAPGGREIQNVRMQVAMVHRVPANRLTWGADDAATLKKYQVRAKSFPYPIAFEAWKQQGGELAARPDGFTYFVGRRELYRHILYDRYTEQGSDAELIIYKGLNRSNLFVTYRANGQIDDYGYFAVTDYRNFLPVPGAFL